MSMMKVERISSKVVSIKPSTPTPNHLRSFKLSLLDQFAPPVFIPIILFYSSPISSSSSSSNTTDHQLDGVSNRLKKSLSETLARFYRPLAGRIKENFLVDCTDEGIEYFESRVNGNISDFMKRDPQHHLLPPYDFHSTLKIFGVNDPHLIVQVTLFDFGGIAICVCMSHKIADATTLATFISTWASIARDDAESTLLGPTFDSAILYPPREGMSPPPISSEIDGTKEGKAVEKMVTRRFVFDGNKIAALRARYGNDSNGQKNKYFPTRVEAVIALIWKTAMAARSSCPKPSVAKLPVDMRRRLVPPLPKQSFGNLSATVTVAAPPSITKSSSNSGEGVDLVSPLRESIRKINNDYLKVLQGDERLVEDFQELEVYWFTSWCRLPWYEADFGWGKPIWVAHGSQPFFKNLICLMDNRTGDGIEAWICMVEEDMAIFERDQELLDFISFVD